MYFSFPTFEIQKKDGTVVSLDTVSSSSIDRKLLQLFLQEFQNLFIDTIPYKDFVQVFGILDFRKGDETYVLSVQKNNEKKIVDRRINGQRFDGDYYEWLTNVLGFPFKLEDWATRFISYKDTPSLQSQVEAIESKLTGKKIELKMQEVGKNMTSQKIRALEDEIEEYKETRKRKEEIELQLRNRSKEKFELEETLNASGDFISDINRIKGELAKFGVLPQLPESTIRQKIKALKQMRLHHVVKILQSLKNRASFFVEHDKTYKKKHSYLLLIFSLFMIAYGLGIGALYLNLQDMRVMLFGIISFFILFGIIISIKISTAGKLDLQYSGELQSPKQSYQDFLGQFDPNEDSFLVNAAWVEALKKEHTRIYAVLEESLQGKSYDQVLNELKEIDQMSNALREEITRLDTERLSSEEYLKKRRELDILKIEEKKQVSEQAKPKPEVDNSSHVPLVILGFPQNADEKLRLLLESLQKHFQVIQML